MRGRRAPDRIRTRGGAPGKLDIFGAKISYVGIEFLCLKRERERGEEKGQRPIFSTGGLRGRHPRTTGLASRYRFPSPIEPLHHRASSESSRFLRDPTRSADWPAIPSTNSAIAQWLPESCLPGNNPLLDDRGR